MPELLGGGGENKPFPCTLRFHPPPILLLLFPPCPPMSTNDWLKTVKCPLSSHHQASVEHRRKMALIPDTPQKPQLHPIIREAQDPTGEAEKDTLWLGNIVPLHSSAWQYFAICNLAFKHCRSCCYPCREWEGGHYTRCILDVWHIVVKGALHLFYQQILQTKQTRSFFQSDTLMIWWQNLSHTMTMLWLSHPLPQNVF